MIMNHLNLTVSDVAAAKGFLEKYFGLVDIGGGNRHQVFKHLRCPLRRRRRGNPARFSWNGHKCY